MRGGHPAQPVAAVVARAPDRGDLRVLGERVVDLAVARLDERAQRRLGELGGVRVGQLVHARDQFGETAGDDEVGAVPLERLHRARRPALDPRQDELDVLAGQVGILLRSRERELLLDDLLGEHEPRVVVAGPPQVPQGAQGVEAGEAGCGQPFAGGVEPERGGSWQDADAVVVPDGVPVAQSFDVVPHPVRVDHPGAGRLGDAEHAAVHVRGHAGDHRPGRLPQPGRPRLADQVVVAADAAAGDDHGLGTQLEVADRDARGRAAPLRVVRLQHLTAYARGRAALDDEVVHTVAEGEADPPLLGVGAYAALERRDHAGTRPPRDVEARDRVAVALGPAVAALGPADQREDPVPHPAQPGPLLPRREVEVRLRPRPGPAVLLAVELRAAEPVLPGQLARVPDAHPALLGAVHEEQPAQAPERLAAQRPFALLPVSYTHL